MRPEREILIKARALIADPAKWRKGFADPGENSGCRCAAEAILHVTATEPLHRAAAIALANAADADIRNWGPFFALPDWNDAPERTHADVLAAFDKAIASAS